MVKNVMSKKINKDFIEKLKQNSTKLVVEFEEKITYEQVLKEIENINHTPYPYTDEPKRIVRDYIEKQEKLLELYKKLAEERNKYYIEWNFNKIGKIEEQIKELEDE